MSRPDTRWFQKNVSGFSGQLLFDEPLSKHTYYRIGGPAAVLAFPKSLEDLSWLARGIQESGIPFFILGQGSNVLVADIGYSGLIIRASKLNLNIEVLPSGVLRTGGSVAISTLLRRAAQEGWGGLEFLTGIPGSVGGAVWMNAGTHLGETKGRLAKVEAFQLLSDQDGTMLARGVESANSTLRTYEGPQLQFQYRKNLFLPGGSIVWAAEWNIEMANPAEVKVIIDQTLARRKATQPIDYPSCGSVFKNPREAGVSAWQVVDQLGLRGFQIGGAQFSEKHSNFIINLGNAKATDVGSLIALAKKKARDELGIILEEEVIYVGSDTGSERNLKTANPE